MQIKHCSVNWHLSWSNEPKLPESKVKRLQVHKSAVIWVPFEKVLELICILGNTIFWVNTVGRCCQKAPHSSGESGSSDVDVPDWHELLSPLWSDSSSLEVANLWDSVPAAMDLSRRSLESQFSSPLTIHALSFNIIPTSTSDGRHLWCKEKVEFSLSHYGKYYLSKEGQHLHL